MRGPRAYSHFLGKGGILGRSLGKISRQNPEKGMFLITAKSYPIPEIGGVPVMRNKHRYPLVLWEWGRAGYTVVLVLFLLATQYIYMTCHICYVITS